MFNTGLRFNSFHLLKTLNLRTHLHPLSLHSFAGTIFWNTAHPLRSLRTSCDSAADFCSDFGHITFLLSLILQKHNIAGGPNGGTWEMGQEKGLKVSSLLHEMHWRLLTGEFSWQCFLCSMLCQAGLHIRWGLADFQLPHNHLNAVTERNAFLYPTLPICFKHDLSHFKFWYF